jgi:ABC-type lipoprotein release transport system permease subunit
MLFSLAYRNLWRNGRRSLLTLSAMIVSLALLILALSIFSGMLRDILASATEQYHGHLVISEGDYQENHDLYTTLAETDLPLIERLADSDQVTGLSPRLRGYGLISHTDNSYPAELLGVHPSQEAGVTSLQRQLVAGSALNDGDDRGAIIGETLARRLGVKPGAELVFVTQAADGSIGNDLLIVRGIFKTGDSAHDNGLLLVPLGWLQRTLALPGQVHEVALAIADPMSAPETAARLRPLLPEGVSIVDWGTLLPQMREAIASFDVSRMIFSVILYFATGLGVLNTLFMSVMERTREFGILMAIGLRPGRIRLLVLLESILLGLLGASLGVAGGLVLCALMRDNGLDLSAWITPISYAGGTLPPRLHTVLELRNLLDPTLMLLLTTLIAGVFPARRAARLQPVAAIRMD